MKYLRIFIISLSLLMVPPVSAQEAKTSKTTVAAETTDAADATEAVEDVVKSIGNVVGVRGSPTASGTEGSRRLKVGSEVFKGDKISTGFLGEVQLLFVDNTRLAIAARSTITLDEYVFSEDNTAEKFVLRAAKGSFRFLSGKSRKDAYKIRTRAATIGIRGTAFDFATRSGTKVIHYNGEVLACASASNCVTLSRKFALAMTRGSGKMFKGSASQLPRATLRFSFPYALHEDRLLGGFRVGSRNCCKKQRGRGLINNNDGRPSNSGDSNFNHDDGGGYTGGGGYTSGG